MKKDKEIKLVYFNEKGEEKTLSFKIKFISNRMIRDFKEVQEAIQKLSNSWDVISKINE